MCVAVIVLVLSTGCAGDGKTRSNQATTQSESPSVRAVDVCTALPADVVAGALGVAINDTARLFGDDDPRSCAYYLDDADTDLGYAASVMTSADNGEVLFDSRCRPDKRPGAGQTATSPADSVVLEVERGDDACAAGGNDLVVRQGDGYVEISIGILVVDLPDEKAYRDAAVAIYDALESSR